mmetsp:Transcript_52919/g.123948  ORF Transcript_52919/g.123948 Transcript_52919/m.123948 type:complete len:114 (-) Transcript_52919:311-652(-)
MAGARACWRWNPGTHHLKFCVRHVCTSWLGFIAGRLTGILTTGRMGEGLCAFEIRVETNFGTGFSLTVCVVVVVTITPHTCPFFFIPHFPQRYARVLTAFDAASTANPCASKL